MPAYEELQVLLSQSNRSISNGDLPQGIEIAVTGAVKLVGQGHPECGVELGLHIIKAANEHDESSAHYDLVKKAVLRIDESIKKGCGEEGLDHRGRLLKAAVKWGTAKAPLTTGDKDFNRIYGEVLLDEGKTPLDKCLSYLIRAEEPRLLTNRVLDLLSSPSERPERDHFLALSILSFLSLSNLRDANAVMDEYLDKGGQGWRPTDKPSVSPMLSFSSALLAICERDAGALFQYLCRAYEGYLNDPAIQQRLAIIGDKFFGIKQPPSMMDMLMNMMGMFGS